MKILNTLAVMASMFMFISFFEEQLHIVPRFHAGTIQADVARIQTYTLSDGTTHVITKGVDPIRYEANMLSIRKHVTCVEKEADCGRSWQPN